MRGKKATRRPLLPDPIYNSPLVTRFINRIMKSGRKETAEHIVYSALEIIKKQERNPYEVFETALRNVSPRLEVKPRRVGGANYQVPMEVRGDRKEALAIRWLIGAARLRPSTEYKTMEDKLAAELLDAFENKGPAIKKKEDTLKMAEANKAFSHFRW